MPVREVRLATVVVRLISRLLTGATPARLDRGAWVATAAPETAVMGVVAARAVTVAPAEAVVTAQIAS